MFRLQGLPERDSAEEKRRTREIVISHFIVFATIVGMLRLTPYVIRALN